MAFLLIVYFLLSSKSCVPDAEPGNDESYKANPDYFTYVIKRESESDHLSEDRLKVFEERAGQRLTDFSDYLNLYADKQTDSLIKREVSNMVRKLFYKQHVPVRFSPGKRIEAQKNFISLDGLFSFIDQTPYESLEFSTSNIRISEPLQPDSIGMYSGKISCTIRIEGMQGNDTILVSTGSAHVGILVSRASKSFGEQNTMEIWQVFLAGIEPAVKHIDSR